MRERKGWSAALSAGAMVGYSSLALWLMIFLAGIDVTAQTYSLVTSMLLTLVILLVVTRGALDQANGIDWCGLSLALVAGRTMIHIADGVTSAVRDAGAHLDFMTHFILGTGQIPSVGSTYTAFPALHVVLGQFTLLTGADKYDAAAVLAALLALCTMVIVAGAAKRWTQVHPILAAAAFVYWVRGMGPGTLYQPMTLAVVMIALMVMAFPRRDDAARYLLFFIAFGVLILTHLYSGYMATAAIILGLIAMWASRESLRSPKERWRRKVTPSHLRSAPITWGAMLLILIGPLAYWGFISSSLWQWDFFDYFWSLVTLGLGDQQADGRFFVPATVVQQEETRSYGFIAGLVMYIGLAEAGMRLWERRGRLSMPLGWLGGFAALFVIGSLFRAAIRSRIFIISAPVFALFIGAPYGRKRLRWALPLVLLVLAPAAFVAFTGPHGAGHTTPWDWGKENARALDALDPGLEKAMSFSLFSASFPDWPGHRPQLVVTGHHVGFDEYRWQPWHWPPRADNAAVEYWMLDEHSMTFGSPIRDVASTPPVIKANLEVVPSEASVQGLQRDAARVYDAGDHWVWKRAAN